MSEWRPIESAPQSRLLLGWMEGWEEHSDKRWRRNGYALIVMHGDEVAPHLLAQAVERIIGNTGYEYYLAPTYWTTLLDPPAEANE